MKNLLLVGLAILLCFCSKKNLAIRQKDTQVYFIPTLHNLHNKNKKYNYDSLKAFISRLEPTLIAVEIRPEDIDSDTLYLKNNYPLEMRQMKYWFPSKKVVGFDWLGDDIANKPIPANYWKEISEIKTLQRQLALDSAFQKKINPCYARSKEREELLKTLSMTELITSVDAEIVINQYECFDKSVANSKYQPLSDFYIKRNKKILENIKAIIRDNRKEKILIITGDDHYAALRGKFVHN